MCQYMQNFSYMHTSYLGLLGIGEYLTAHPKKSESLRHTWLCIFGPLVTFGQNWTEKNNIYVPMPFPSDDGVSCRGDVWAPVSHYFLWILVWPMRPILAVNCRPQSSQMKDLVLSEDAAAGTDWLVEPFRSNDNESVIARISDKMLSNNLNLLWDCVLYYGLL